MEPIILLGTLLSITFGGADIILLFSALGGLSGLAAVLTVFVTHRANSRRARVDDKSVAITELEKAVPGMGDIIKEWQRIVTHLQEENTTLRADNSQLKSRLDDLDHE